MKHFYLAAALFLFSCERKAEFYIDGKGYYTSTECIQDHNEYRYDYHYGYDVLKGEFRFHFGGHNVTVCDCYKTDTIEIVKD